MLPTLDSQILQCGSVKQNALSSGLVFYSLVIVRMFSVFNMVQAIGLILISSSQPHHRQFFYSFCIKVRDSLQLPNALSSILYGRVFTYC